MTGQTLEKLLFPNTDGIWNDTLPDGERGDRGKCPDIRRKEKEKLAPSSHRQPGKD